MSGFDSRLAACWWPDHDDGNPSRVEQSTRHGTVELGRGHILVLGNVVDTVDERGALAAVPGRVGRDLGSTASSASLIMLKVIAGLTVKCPSRRLLAGLCWENGLGSEG